MLARTDSGHDKATTVVLVDEESFVRGALTQTLTAGGFDIIGEAGDGMDAVTMVIALRPDVVMIGLSLPRLSGLGAIAKMGLQAPASRILVLTHSVQNRVVGAIVAGASGYILKSSSSAVIVDAVRATAGGESVLSREVVAELVQRIRERDIPVTADSASAANAIRAVLTARELEIFQLLASGASNQQIGVKLTVGTNTVSNHVASILAKLHLDNRIQAAVQAVRSGLS